ncbi:MAG: RagB/SusD family nutrient uptake outer membrane protein [Prevotella sp.]
MNKYIKLFIVSIGLVSMYSCNDTIDLDTDGHTNSDEIWTDRNNTRGYLNNCYQHRIGGYLSTEGFTDLATSVEKNTVGSSYARWYNDDFSVNDFYAYNMEGNLWSNFFEGIRKCNVFLEHVDGATGDETQEEKDGWKAQALTLRAYYYLELMKRFGQVPLLLKDMGKGADYSGVKKATVGEIAQQIIADCEAALAMPDTQEGFSWNLQDNQNGMMTRGVCYALEAEAITYAKSPLFEDGTFTWDYAVQVTGNALNQLLSHGYELWTTVSPNHINEYDSYFAQTPYDKRAVDKETIYATNGQFNLSLSNGLPFVDGQSSAGLCPNQELIDCYDMKDGTEAVIGYKDAQHLQINAGATYNDNDPYSNRDPRLAATVWFNGSTQLPGGQGVEIQTYDGGNATLNTSGEGLKYTVTGYYMHKYIDGRSNKSVNYDGYIRTKRLADIYFLFAECAYQASSADNQYSFGNLKISAKQAIDKVRARVGMPALPNGMDKSTFERRLRKERAVEFAFEGKRQFDLRRWKSLSSYKVVTGMKAVKNGTAIKYERFVVDARKNTDDKYLLFPLDNAEATKMETITGNNWQNPGW